jgi:hypothetical protein
VGGFLAGISIQVLTYEPGSKLRCIVADHFRGHSSLRSLCIPASVESIDFSVFLRTQISNIEVEEGSSHFRTSGHFLVDFAGLSLIRSFDQNANVVIGRDIEILCESSFSGHPSLSSLTFESNSRLRRIEKSAFSECRSLKVICLPASVEYCAKSFLACSSIQTLTFESNSKLRQFEPFAFSGCSSLGSICIPASVEV